MEREAPAGPPVVPLPGRLDRRLRLGPFPSGRDAIKFLVYAGVGAVFAPTPYPYLAVPFVAVGGVVALLRPGGETIDGRLVVWARFAARRFAGGPSMSRGRSRAVSRGAVTALPDGRYASVVRAAGVPLAFLPPQELERRFELFRAALRAGDGSLAVLVTTAPLHARSVLPPPAGRASSDRAARDGYAQLLLLLVSRRAVRRVFLASFASGPRADAESRLGLATTALVDRLAEIGVTAEPLVGRTLWAATARLGLRRGRSSE